MFVAFSCMLQPATTLDVVAAMKATATASASTKKSLKPGSKKKSTRRLSPDGWSIPQGRNGDFYGSYGTIPPEKPAK